MIVDLVVGEVQPMPVDDRVTAQHQAHGLEIGERETLRVASADRRRS